MSMTPQVWCDQLDGSVSFSRQPTDKTPEEVLQIGLREVNTLWNFIKREAMCGDEAYYDVGCCTLGKRPEYFLWIKLSIEDGDKLVKKYKL